MTTITRTTSTARSIPKRFSTRDADTLRAALDRSPFPPPSFDTYGSMTGARRPYSQGRLQRQYYQLLADADYAIYSYATPIAFRVPVSVQTRLLLDELSDPMLNPPTPTAYSPDHPMQNTRHRVLSSHAPLHEQLWPGSFGYTLIARKGHLWVIPGSNYSATTQRHKSTVFSALLSDYDGRVIRYWDDLNN